jgi:diguanylate cyclase (GGDEF)-like protein/PAS domain S-box-containing protein
MKQHDADDGTTRTRYVPYWLVVMVCYVVSFSGAASLWVRDYRDVQIAAEVLAREQGAIVFNLIQLSRQWNAEHGGVWVEETASSPANPYLDHAERDLLTVDGKRLTMVNPAYMTRQMAEMAGESDTGLRLRFHLTSLNPIRPDNRADVWESESLRMFEAGAKERLSYFDAGTGSQASHTGSPAYRYMAPLPVTSACMDCHAKQNYKVGDIRGGISVTMEANHFRDMVRSQRESKTVSYFAMALLFALLLHSVAWRSYRYAAHMRRIQREQELTILERTAALSESGARYRGVFDTVTEAIMVLDDRGTVVQVNPAFTRITGYTAEVAVGQSVDFLRSGHHDQKFFAMMDAALVAQGHWEGDYWIRRQDGGLLVVWQSVTRLRGELPAASGGVVPMAAEAGSVLSGGLVITFFDITARKTEEDAVRHLAQHDLLTELPNRGLFLDRLGKALEQAERHQRLLAVMYFDLDKFKAANDTLGHAAGDAILQQTAQRALRCVRAADTVARFGGDEFAILLPEVHGEDEALDIAGRLVASMAEPFFLSEGKAEVSVSVGLALFPVHGTTALELQQRADKALYAVKRAGRNACRIYSPDCEA